MANQYIFDKFGSAAARKGQDLPPPENYERIGKGRYKLTIVPCTSRVEFKSKCCGSTKLKCSAAGVNVTRKNCFDCGGNIAYANEHFKIRK